MASKWFAAFLGFLIPPLAFVYLAKLRIAVLCLLILLGSIIPDFHLTPFKGVSLLPLVLSLLSAVYAFVLAKKIELGSNRKWYSHWWGVLSIPVVFIVLIFLIRSFVVEPFYLPSKGMSPSLKAGDTVLVKKWGYGSYGSLGITLINREIKNRAQAERGDVMIIKPPHNPRFFVKRVIGLPGDIVEFGDKQLLINGARVNTEDLGKGMINETLGGNTYTVKYVKANSPLRSGQWIVPDGHYFVMGDNRDNSADSRMWGMVPVKNMVGRVLIKW